MKKNPKSHKIQEFTWFIYVRVWRLIKKYLLILCTDLWSFYNLYAPFYHQITDYLLYFWATSTWLLWTSIVQIIKLIILADKICWHGSTTAFKQIIQKLRSCVLVSLKDKIILSITWLWYTLEKTKSIIFLLNWWCKHSWVWTKPNFIKMGSLEDIDLSNLRVSSV